MRLEEAFSLQFGDTITAERAYELYWAGVIDDQRAFQCPQDDCTAQVTCANMCTAEQDLKVQPHYRPYGEHIAGCTFSDKATSGGGRPAKDGLPAASLHPDIPDVFHFSRPADHFVARDAADGPEPVAARKASARAGQSSNQSGSRRRHHYSVSNLVSRWLRLRDENRLDVESVQIGGDTQTYRQLFKGVYHQEAEKYTRAPFVFWGKARATRLPYGYRIALDKKMTVGGQAVRPSLLLRDSVIEQCPYRKRVLANLDKAIADDHGTCVLFVYGAPEIVPDAKSATDTGPATKSFINFNVTSVDMLDVHRVSLYERLSKAKAVESKSG